MKKIEEEMQSLTQITKNSYLILKKEYGEEQILSYLKKIVTEKEKEYQELKEEQDNINLYNIQLELWNKYGYCFSILKYYPFFDIIVKRISKTGKNTKSQNKLPLQEEVKYCFQLLSRDYITILDENNNLDIKRIFSLANNRTKKRIIELMNNFYQEYKFGSNYDKRNIIFLKNESQNIKEIDEEEIEDSLLNEVVLYIDNRVAKYQLVMHNYNLIGYGLKMLRIEKTKDLDDFQQEGFIGLEQATNKFDMRQGYKFSTYAVFWIKQAIQRALVRYQTVPVPHYLNAKYYKIKIIELDYIKKYGQKPSFETLSIITGLSLKEIMDTITGVESSKSISINQIITTKFGKDTCTIEEILTDEKDGFEPDIINKELQANFFGAIKEILTEKEYNILLLLMGVGIEEPMSSKELAQRYGITRQRIEQIRDMAIKKLKRSGKIKKLNPFN